MQATQEIKIAKNKTEDRKFEKLGDLFSFTGGGTPDKGNSEYWNGDIKWASVKDVKAKYIINTEDRITKKGLDNSSSQLAKPGELILITRIYPGKVAITKDFVAINQDLKIVRPKREINLIYAYYIFGALENLFIKKSSGTTVLGIRLNEINEIEIPIPSTKAQQRIVEKIEELFSELDYAISTLKTTQQQLQTYRQSVLKHAFQGHFTGGNKKWKLDRIGNVLDFINNGYTPSAAKMSDKGDVQFIKVYNLNFDGTLNYSKNPVFISKDVHENELKRSRTYPNDVLINIVGPPLGKVSLVPPIAKEFNINQAIVLFRPNEKATPKFLRYFLQSPEVINWLEGTSKATAGQYNIKVSTCREILFPIIDTTLQEKIVFEIETRLSESDYLLQTINQQLIRAESLRQSILQRAFSGEL